MNDESDKKPPAKPGILHIVLSTLAAAFGVQSNKNRERDFRGGSIYTYIIAGVTFTVIFIVLVVLVVRLVLKNAGL